MAGTRFLAGPRDTGPPLGDEDDVGDRQVRGRVAVEDELGLDQPVVHRPGRFRRPRSRNSDSALATTAEIVTPASWACWRTRLASDAGSLTVNTTLASGTATRPPLAAWSTYRRACRIETPNRSASTRTASAVETPTSASSAAALIRSACSRSPTRRPPAMP